MPHKESLKNWRLKQRAKGLCIDCVNPAVPSLRSKLGVFCKYHLELHREQARMLPHAKSGTPAPPFPLDAFMGLSAADLSYAAGLVDGEGCVNLYRYEDRIRISVS